MTANHNFFSKLAFNIAQINLGRTKTNPSVGCVIVKDGSVISSGVTSVNGRPHAEFNALNKKLNFKGSTLYVTLEPCSHYGLTPPCTNIIKNKKIKDVYYCYNDPDLRSHKKAKIKLSKKNIKIKKIETKENDFYKSYFLNKKNKIPLIDAKFAVSKDNYSIDKRSKWITNERSRKIAHLLRSRYDSIISTAKSINKDNSLLNCRINGFDNNKPDVIIVDRNLRLKKKLKMFKLNNRKIYILTSSNNKKKISYFKKNKIKIIKISKLVTRDDFNSIFKKLFKIGKRRILVESGLIFLTKLIRFKMINDLFLFKSNNRLNSFGYNNKRPSIISNLKLKRKINVNLSGNELYKIRIN